MQLTAKVLGEVRINADGSSIDLGGPRQRRLLAALLVHHGSTVSTDELVEAVFEGEPPEAAWRTFRTYVSRLRRSLEAGGVDGSSVVVTVPSGYATAADLDIDSDRFEQLLRSGRRRLEDGDVEGALASLEQALGLWSGSAYVEFASAEWARPEAVRLDELHLVARELHAAAMVESGRHSEAIAEIEALVVAEPLREEPRRLLMLALYRSGRHAEALRAGREFRAHLAQETGLEWGPAIADLEQMIIDRDPRLDAVHRGRRVHGYVLGQAFVTAAHGVTYRASQPSVGRDVAITVIPAELADDASFVRRFDAQAERIASIEHPNIVPVLDYWREPGGAYVVTRFMSGGTLASRLDDSTAIDEESAIEIVVDIGRALLAAAEHGVHHGRLTPEHVLFDRQGRAHLAGFELVPSDEAGARDIASVADIAELIWKQLAGRDAGVAVHATAIAEIAAAAHRPAAIATVAELVDELLAAARDDHVEHPHRLLLDATSAPNPYRGLHAFTEADAEVFFGRRATVAQLAADLRRDSFVVLVGPSGSGKSSVVRAGLLPQLRVSGALVATMVPGHHPVAQLEVALSRLATAPVPELTSILGRPHGLVEVLAAVLPGDDPRLVLLLDQLEEALTMSDPVEWDLVIAALARALDEAPDRVQVVATARADFLGRILEHPGLGPMVRDHSRLITPLDADELYEAIVEPAATAGVMVEPELATSLVADSVDAPGSLPLLQFALTELYDRRVAEVMTLDAYRDMGGLGASISDRAESVYRSLTADEQMAARRLFARLVTLHDGAQDTRHRVAQSDLATVPPPVLDAFGAARLVTFDRDPQTREPTVEIAHEALIRHWPRLRAWLDEDRSGLLILRRLTASSRSWEAAGREPGELYRGGRLASTEEWAERHGDDLNPLEREFLDASIRAREDGLARDRRRARRLRSLAVALAAIAAIALAAVVVAVVQRNRADSSATEAEQRTIEAEESAVRADVQRLIAQASSAVDADPDLPILLTLEAYERQQRLGEDPPGSLIAAMQTAVQSSRVLHRSVDGAGWAATVGPDGRTMVLGSQEDERVAIVVDVGSGEEVGRIDTGAEIGQMEIDPSGQRLGVLHFDREGEQLGVRTRWFITIHDLSTSEELLRTSRESCCIAFPRFSPDWRFVAAPDIGYAIASGGPRRAVVWERRAVVWDLRRPELRPLTVPKVALGGWTADGETLVVYDDESIRFVDPSTGEDVAPALQVAGARSVDVHPERDELLVVRDDIEVWRPGTTEPAVVLPTSARAGATDVARFTSQGSAIVVYGIDDEIRVVDIDSGDVMSLRGNPHDMDVSVSADGTSLLASGDDGAVLWDLTAAGPRELRNLPTEGAIGDVVIGGDDSTAVVIERDSLGAGAVAQVRRIDLASGSEVATSGTFVADAVATSAAGPYAAAGPGGRPGRLADLDDTDLGIELDPCEEPRAIDEAGRWLLVAASADKRCDLADSRVIDPATGEELLELDRHHAGLAAFGPTGTIADGLLAYQYAHVGTVQPVHTGIVVRRVPDGRILGYLEADVWQPMFSEDGRYLSFGSPSVGGFAIDVDQVLSGTPMDESIVLNPTGGGGATTYSVVGAGSLVTGHAGEVLRFHDLGTGAEWMTLPVDTGRSTHLRFSPDDRYLYYESAGGVIRRFPLDHVELAELAQARVQREFTAEECERFDIADDCSIYETNPS